MFRNGYPVPALALLALLALALPATPAMVLAGPHVVGPLSASPMLAPTIADTPAAPLDDPAFLTWHADVTGDSGSNALPDQDEDPLANVDACMAADMADKQAHGASIAIMNEGEFVHVRGYGLKHPEQAEEVDAETLFRIGSTTKMMTAAGVLQLAEQGKVDLDAPITRYAPDFNIAAPWQASAIKTRHLLTHSAGIPDDLSGAFGPTSLVDWAADRGHVQLYAPPGSFFNYSNPSWSLAGLVLQLAGGQPYRERLVEHVWRPAGMTRTTMDTATVIADGNYSFGGQNGQAIAPDAYDSLWGGPAGFAFSTPTELVTWTKLLMDGGGEVLAPESAAAMQAMQVGSDTRPGLGYGFGIFRSEELPGLTLLDHGGNIDGWSSQLMWIPERGFAVSVLATSPSSLSNAARCALLEIVQPELPPQVDLRTDPATWDRYTGTYVIQDRFGQETSAWIERTPEGLRAWQGEALNFPLVQRYLDTFQEDLDEDGQGDGDTVSFIAHPERPERAEWIRNRGFVGIRAGEFPRSVEMKGNACGTLTFTAHAAMPAPAASGWGLDNLIVEREDVPVSGDDPEDPSSAGFKLDLRAEEAVAYIEARIAGEADDDLDLFLLHDSNGDGQFAHPDELVSSSATATANEFIEAGGVEPLPAGEYQLWVQGWEVTGMDSTFDLDVLMILGDGLRIEGLPGAIASGEDVEASVCADPAAIAGADGPRRGTIVLATGGVPRHVVIPVRWSPSEAPDPDPPAGQAHVFLPWARR